MTDAWATVGPGTPWYLLVESQGHSAPQEAGFRRDALAQAEAGRPVLMFLVQDGVALALPGSDATLDDFQRAGGRLVADDFSLTQRGLDGRALRPTVRVTGMGEMAEWMLDPDVKVVWH
ncbi:hypothetical protein ACFVUY_27780 [Kitasatospora sp. NPDC058063]|uniref:hypothetical protein n=1 Tax=unclassified Kitasatospora TaxID=2633591 RepID=UPI0036DA420B